MELGVHYSQTIRQILLIPLKAVKELKKRGLPFGNSEKQDSWVSIPGSGSDASFFLPTPKTGTAPWKPGSLEPWSLLLGCKAGSIKQFATEMATFKK